MRRSCTFTIEIQACLVLLVDLGTAVTPRWFSPKTPTWLSRLRRAKKPLRIGRGTSFSTQVFQAGPVASPAAQYNVAGTNTAQAETCSISAMAMSINMLQACSEAVETTNSR